MDSRKNDKLARRFQIEVWILILIINKKKIGFSKKKNMKYFSQMLKKSLLLRNLEYCDCGIIYIYTDRHEKLIKSQPFYLRNVKGLSVKWFFTGLKVMYCFYEIPFFYVSSRFINSRIQKNYKDVMHVCLPVCMCVCMSLWDLILLRFCWNFWENSRCTKFLLRIWCIQILPLLQYFWNLLKNCDFCSICGAITNCHSNFNYNLTIVMRSHHLILSILPSSTVLCLNDIS